MSEGEPHIGHCAVIGTGQIGTFAIRELAETGWTVTAADLVPNAAFIRRYACAGCPVHSLDVADPAQLEAFFETFGPFDVVVFAAGLTGRSAVAEPERAEQVLLNGVRNIIDICRRSATRRLVCISSLAVYQVAPDTAHPLCETSSLNGTVGVYGKMIRRMESSLCDSGGISVAILRAAGVYGPTRFGHGSHSSRLIERLLYGSAQEASVRLRGHWEDRDDFVYVRDLGRAIAVAAGQDGEDYEIINVGTGRTTSLRDLVETVRDVVGRCEVVLEPPRQARSPLYRPALDISRMATRLGPSKYSLEQGLDDFAGLAGLCCARAG